VRVDCFRLDQFSAIDQFNHYCRPAASPEWLSRQDQDDLDGLSQ